MKNSFLLDVRGLKAAGGLVACMTKRLDVCPHRCNTLVIRMHKMEVQEMGTFFVPGKNIQIRRKQSANFATLA